MVDNTTNNNTVMSTGKSAGRRRFETARALMGFLGIALTVVGFLWVGWSLTHALWSDDAVTFYMAQKRAEFEAAALVLFGSISFLLAIY